MNIGFIGLGKLGLPVALAIEEKGHNVCGFDINENIINILNTKKLPYTEKGAESLLQNSKIKFQNMSAVVKNSEIIFVTIQTPHEEKFEGVTRIPNDRKDFNYEHLIKGMIDLSAEIDLNGKDKIVVIISTVLPGSINKFIKPVLSPLIKLCYNPFFIAMGTTIDDFLNSEIILFGVEDQNAVNQVEKFYKTINNSPFFRTTIENAELIKVVYNTFISTKISMMNTVMETCHKLPNTNIDDVTRALSMCTTRIVSDKYLRGGMGDGGGCHPRDNIALSWLANNLDISYNWYDNIMKQRELQTEWFAKLIISNKIDKNDTIYILGKCFKPETNLILGSPSILLKNILEELGEKVVMWDPYIDGSEKQFKDINQLNDKPALFFIGTEHQYFKKFDFVRGSVVIDPFRYLALNTNFKYIPIGKNT